MTRYTQSFEFEGIKERYLIYYHLYMDAKVRLQV